ncbi:hypothetical protein GCM10010472_11080 [Pseudonocardia halophobica]|uniref:Uncharacterized protein n=1 Tax=Pseudonocardia halophobica TaxID=29401 RepID=A0A9W6NXH8_9PSEU|nr:hypothetical protein [Pseudonocardia halophobica]GLL13495.1 hypothetical protein GCM10017577_46390 [Pseudonocardia halophobica]
MAHPALPALITETPTHDHAAWCAHHTDGLLDQMCDSQPWLLTPAAFKPADPGRVTLRAFQYQELTRDTHAWDVQPPQLEIFLEGADGKVGAALTPREARKVAAQLLHLVDLVERETGRVTR